MKYERFKFHTRTHEITGLYPYADMYSIEKEINTYFESIFPRINTEDLSGWSLAFFIYYRCTDFIAIDKQFTRCSLDKECEISMYIPIPDNRQAPYGIPPIDDGSIGSFHPAIEKIWHLAEPEYDQYVSLDQYVLAATIKAIDLGFSQGFTFYRKKIKFQDL
ncbi:hypothetical protein AXE65_08240 [Ventosimonas gracilis]|uniref:Uncharacterized protein n=1 Tax=Ventosimonas gracilis TaxID=1680762 RepID=A0A139SY13_9GAMM|nr:Imm9 family immunity protein [Ventosimonas gracilis]KXU39483.1 hypothetical protein AXE65_08240 [Ventosimonas gracilis]